MKSYFVWKKLLSKAPVAPEAVGLFYFFLISIKILLTQNILAFSAQKKLKKKSMYILLLEQYISFKCFKILIHSKMSFNINIEAI